MFISEEFQLSVIDESIIKVNGRGFSMWLFIAFLAFFGQITSVPRV